MRSHCLVVPLALIPFLAFSQPNLPPGSMLFSQNPIKQNTIIKSYSNETRHFQSTENIRTIDYPTQIIRIAGQVSQFQLNCDQLNAEIDKVLINYITEDKFTYTTYIYCHYNPDTQMAIDFEINSYFDPLNDTAVDYLKNFLSEHNGADLLGTKLQIEAAQGLVVALNVQAGVKKKPDSPPFIEYRQDRKNLYFKNNYDMRMKLFADVSENFFSDDPNKVLPFLSRWLFPNAGGLYRAVLRDANYVELQPDSIFLMNNGKDIFVSKLRYYFAHDCNQYENHRCLINGG